MPVMVSTGLLPTAWIVPLQGSPRRRSGSQRGEDKIVRLIPLDPVATRIWYLKKEVELMLVFGL